MKLLDGRLVSAAKTNEIAEQVNLLREKTGKVPFLVAVLVGNDAASQVYVRNKEKACVKVGFRSEVDRLPEDLSEEKLLDLVDKLNQDPDVNGILVQLPLPAQIDPRKVIDKISPHKDVDCFHPENVGRLLLGEPVFLPATPAGVLELLKYYNIDTSGKHVVVIGRSNIVGKPLANMLVQKSAIGNATVTIVHSQTRNLAKITKQADILIAAIGQPEFVKANMVKNGAVVIDVGVNRVEDSSFEKGYRLTGDVLYSEVSGHVSWITPVPGGVGPMTITMLLNNTLKAFKMQNEIE